VEHILEIITPKWEYLPLFYSETVIIWPAHKFAIKNPALFLRSGIVNCAASFILLLLVKE
jgi:hypothetical protein